jgi:hypothetical protein
MNYWYFTPPNNSNPNGQMTPVTVFSLPMSGTPLIPAIAVVEPPPGLDLSLFTAGEGAR